jgi:replicative DNA helicase
MKTTTVFDPLITGLPQHLQAERFVLASVMIDDRHMDTIRDLLVPDDFTTEAHRLIWARCCAMHDAGQRIDICTVGSACQEANELEAVGGLAYLAELTNGMPLLSNLEEWIRIVRQKAVKRRAIQCCYHAAQRLSTTDDDAAEVFAETERVLSELDGQLAGSGGFQTPAEVIQQAGGTDRYLQRRRESGLQTPFPTLNAMTGGLRPGDLAVIAANTGCGKTALAVNLAVHFCVRGHAGAIFSLEMDAEQITDRIISARSGLDSQILRRGDAALLDSDKRAAVSRAIAGAAELPVFISDRNRSTVPAMFAELRRQIARHQLEFVIVDYIQLVEGVGRFDKRADEVASITRGLKRMAGELKLPIIALSQFNRESAKDGREPQLHDLRESGSIEQDASLVLMVHFTRMHDVNAGIDTGDAKLLVRKQRNGPIGWIPVTFHAPSGRFFEPEASQ